ncbi:MAG: ABC transporter permease [Candidatus Bathyarchaeota archaeon]|jgi:peptide/nickel transport system permease protein|nr:ABC transporter permease [Candidatus Bathyarchaeota archaeon]
MGDNLNTEFEGKAISELRLALRQLKKDRMSLIGLMIIVGMIFLAIFSPFLIPYDPAEQDLNNALEPPSVAHLFGTDSFGRDVLSRVLSGARVSVIVGIVSCGIAILIGVPLGILAGYGGSKVDNLISRIIDGIMAFPPLLLAIVLMAVLGPSMINVMIALGFTISTHFARLARGETLKVKEESYIMAARTMGLRSHQIIIKHIIPNIIAPLIVQTSVTFAYAIIAEASLSFLGLGVQPPTPSWGLDLSDARRYVLTDPWLAMFPGIAIFLAVFGVNMFGDGLNSALNPRERRRL